MQPNFGLIAGGQKHPRQVRQDRTEEEFRMEPGKGGRQNLKLCIKKRPAASQALIMLAPLARLERAAHGLGMAGKRLQESILFNQSSRLFI